MKYDFFVAGRYSNYKNLKAAVDAIRGAGKTAYCCIENEYDSDGIVQVKNPRDEDIYDNVAHIKDWQTNPTFKKMFQKDMNSLKNSTSLLMVLPAGFSSHMELGVAYGMNKPCYGVGQPEKVETLYLMFEEIFPDVETMLRSLK